MQYDDSNHKPFDPVFLDKLPTGIVVLRQNKPIFINKKAREDLKLTIEDLNIDKILQFLDPTEYSRFLKLSQLTPLPEKTEWKALTFKGTATWIQLRVAPLDGEHNLVIIRNIGKVKKLLAELSATEKQYKALIDSVPNFLFIFKNGSIEYYNHAFIDKLGYSEEEIERQKNMPTFLVAPEHREKVARVLLDSKRRLVTGNIPIDSDETYQLPEETSEFDLLHKNGSRVPVYGIIRRVFSRNDYIVQGVLIDLSDIKELNDMKFDFLTMSQHQLRSPIATLKGHLDFYIKRISDGVDPEEKSVLELKLLEIFDRNLKRMINMIDDLNDIAAIRHGKFKCNLRGEDFVPVLQKTIEDLSFLLHQYRVHISVQLPSNPYVVNLDHNRISQALRNVLENAIKFTGHGNIDIRLFKDMNSENMTLIIEDNGVGINREHLEDVGKPFMTFHPSASKLGLGLYLTKQIIENHNGTFEILSEGFHKGTIVKIRLPLLVSPIEDTKLASLENGDILRSIKLATSSESMVHRMEALKKLENKKFSDIELKHVISTLEHIILYDSDRTIRNLASILYSSLIEKRKKSDHL